MEVKAPSVTNMLAGRLPGLRAVQRSGSPFLILRNGINIILG